MHHRSRRIAGSLVLPALMLLIVAPASARTTRAERDHLPLGTPEQRGELFDEIVRKTLAREQFSAPKNARLGLDFERDALPLRAEFVGARTEQDLYYALVRLSNLRRDPHLGLQAIPTGVTGGRPEGRAAPILLDVHHGEPRFLFVSDVDRDLARSLPDAGRPRFGDRVVGVNGLDFATYLARARPYLPYATEASLWVALAEDLTWTLPAEFPPAVQGETLKLELERPDGSRYGLEVPYLETREIHWSGWADNQSYPGHRLVLETRSFALYRPEQSRPVLVLQVRGFHPRTLPDDLAQLMDYARRNHLLAHHVVCDLTRSLGGNRSWLLLQHLSARPFRPVRSDIRLSDVTPLLIERAPRSIFMHPAASPMRAYTANVPKALRIERDDPDGLLRPAPTHFSGHLVAFFGPASGSSVDQFAAAFVDNELGHSIGMPTAGFSNSWEWRETLILPGTSQPLLDFQWSIGRTIRPNGEVLEGNPPTPREVVTFTRENYRDRYATLLERAYAYLSGPDPLP